MKFFSIARVVLSAFVLFADKVNMLDNPDFVTGCGEEFPAGWVRAYHWQPENFSFPSPGTLRLATPDGQRTVQSLPMPVPENRDLRFSVRVAAESGTVKGHIYLIDGRFGWCRPQEFEVDTQGRVVEVSAFASDYRQKDRIDFYARIDIDSPGALLVADPLVVCPVLNLMPLNEYFVPPMVIEPVHSPVPFHDP